MIIDNELFTLFARCDKITDQGVKYMQDGLISLRSLTSIDIKFER